MKFFHVYNERFFPGLEKNGMLNKDTGFKIQNCFAMPAEAKFNQIAAKGSKLYNLIKDNNYAFYVDRIAGGITWHDYPYDKELIAEYKKLLGQWFLGFQLHESGSNRRRAEWPRIIKVMGSKGPYDKKELDEKMISKTAVTPEGVRLHSFSQDNLDYYANKTYAETYPEFMEEMKELFSRRMADTDNAILPCDSYFLATKLQDEMGMNTFMPEVGCQIPLMRLAVALARGVAKSTGKTWGAYYECWREVPGVGYCMPCFNSDPSNEWYLPQSMHGDDFSSYGENGGSSRLLQNRIYFHALMSGADYFSEEWGLNCSYSDMDTFELSEYGQVKKDFINTALTLQNIKAEIPFAIVLPKSYACIELPDIFTPWKIGEHRSDYLSSQLTPEETEYFGHMEDVLKLFFARNGEVIGNEGHVLTNSRFGDVVDIIYEDAPMEAMQAYEYLIDATPSGDFAKAMAGKGLKILESGDLETLAAAVEALIPQVMYAYVDGLHWVLSTGENGRRFVTIFNNEGNERDLDKGNIIHSEADRTVRLSLNEPCDLKIIAQSKMECSTELRTELSYMVTVPAAGFVVLELVRKAKGPFERNYNAKTTRSNRWPTIKKNGIISPNGEMTPFVWNGKLMRMEWYSPGKSANPAGQRDVIIRDCQSKEIISHFAPNINYPAGYLEGDTFYVTGTDVNSSDIIRMYWTKDLLNWEERVLFTNPGWHYYNTALTKGHHGYVLLMEAGEPTELVGDKPFTFFFATSPDLKTWTHMDPSTGFSQNRYMGGPWMKYSEGWYYVISVTELPCLRYTNYLYRTKDFQEWQVGYYNPILMPSPEDLVLAPNAADITPEFYDAIQKHFDSNNSDIDMCDYNGQVYINYEVGDQLGFGYMAEAVADGTVADFLKSYFE